jgi:chaperonin cofactor prefoldin
MATGGMDEIGNLAKQSVATNGAKLGTALFTYAIKVPVSVPRGQSAMIPFVSGPIQAEPVAIYDPGVQADHPLSGARLKNTTGLHLMGGPLTVFDTGANGNGYVGDALMDDTEPGQTRLISYALDLAVDAHAEPGAGSGETTSVVIVQGVLRITTKQVQSTVYTFKNNGDAAQTVVVEHPRQGDDWTLLEPATPTERTATLLRFDVPVAAGASRKFVVREEYPQVETDGLLDTGEDTLLLYTHNGAAAPAVQAALQEVVARRRAVADTQARVAALNARIQAISDGQTRIRDNMKALDHASALYKRYVAELDAQETTLETLQSQADALQTQLAQQQAALNDYVAHLSVG